MRIEAVIFDLGGVVIESPFPAFRAFEAEHGLPEGAVTRAILAGGEEGPWPALEAGAISYETFCAELDEAAAAEGAPFDTAALMARLGEACQVVPEMLETVRRVRAGGRKVAALTNNWNSPDPLRDRMAALGEEFDVFVESWRVRMRKPQAAIYQLVCGQLDLHPAACVFLDDIGQNLKMARALGMTTIKVADPATAAAELERLLAADV